jgi:hypothetical protein
MAPDIISLVARPNERFAVSVANLHDPLQTCLVDGDHGDFDDPGDTVEVGVIYELVYSQMGEAVVFAWSGALYPTV